MDSTQNQDSPPKKASTILINSPLFKTVQQSIKARQILSEKAIIQQQKNQQNQIILSANKNQIYKERDFYRNRTVKYIQSLSIRKIRENNQTPQLNMEQQRKSQQQYDIPSIDTTPINQAYKKSSQQKNMLNDYPFYHQKSLNYVNSLKQKSSFAKSQNNFEIFNNNEQDNLCNSLCNQSCDINSKSNYDQDYIYSDQIFSQSENNSQINSEQNNLYFAIQEQQNSINNQVIVKQECRMNIDSEQLKPLQFIQGIKSPIDETISSHSEQEQEINFSENIVTANVKQIQSDKDLLITNAIFERDSEQDDKQQQETSELIQNDHENPKYHFYKLEPESNQLQNKDYQQICNLEQETDQFDQQGTIEQQKTTQIQQLQEPERNELAIENDAQISNLQQETDQFNQQEITLIQQLQEPERNELEIENDVQISNVQQETDQFDQQETIEQQETTQTQQLQEPERNELEIENDGQISNLQQETDQFDQQENIEQKETTQTQQLQEPESHEFEISNDQNIKILESETQQPQQQEDTNNVNYDIVNTKSDIFVQHNSQLQDLETQDLYKLQTIGQDQGQMVQEFRHQQQIDHKHADYTEINVGQSQKQEQLQNQQTYDITKKQTIEQYDNKTDENNTNSQKILVEIQFDLPLKNNQQIIQNNNENESKKEIQFDNSLLLNSLDTDQQQNQSFENTIKLNQIYDTNVSKDKDVMQEEKIKKSVQFSINQQQVCQEEQEIDIQQLDNIKLDLTYLKNIDDEDRKKKKKGTRSVISKSSNWSSKSFKEQAEDVAVPILGTTLIGSVGLILGNQLLKGNKKMIGILPGLAVGLVYYLKKKNDIQKEQESFIEEKFEDEEEEDYQIDDEELQSQFQK